MPPEAGALGDVPRVRQSAVHGALAHVRVEDVLADAAQRMGSTTSGTGGQWARSKSERRAAHSGATSAQAEQPPMLRVRV